MSSPGLPFADLAARVAERVPPGRAYAPIDLAALLGLHPNTMLNRLPALVAAGLLEPTAAASGGRSTGGRRKLYRRPRPQGDPVTYTLLTQPDCPNCPRWRGLLESSRVRAALAEQGAAVTERGRGNPEWAALVEHHGIQAMPALVSPSGRVLRALERPADLTEFLAAENPAKVSLASAEK